MRGRNGFTAAGALLALGLCVAASALAAKPTRTFIPYGGLSRNGVTLEGICDFPVHVDPRRGREYAKTYSDGHQLITGQTKATLTNLDSGRRVRINAPVAAEVDTETDGSVVIRFRGRWFAYFFAGELGLDSPSFMRIYSGQEVLRYDALGQPHLTHRGGTSRDLCAALAS